MCADMCVGICVDMCADMCGLLKVGVASLSEQEAAGTALPEVDSHTARARIPSLHIGTADGISIARVGACRYSK